jgi:signal peptidase
MGKIFKITFDVLFIIAIVLLCVYFILRFLGIAEIYRVETGSMEEKIHTGDYILIYKKKDYDVGDIITYESETYNITHRIIDKNGDVFTTKGDANNIPDEEVNLESIIGKVVYHGGLLNFLIDFKFAIASALLGIYLISYYLDKKENENKDVKGE